MGEVIYGCEDSWERILPVKEEEMRKRKGFVHKGLGHSVPDSGVTASWAAGQRTGNREEIETLMFT